MSEEAINYAIIVRMFFTLYSTNNTLIIAKRIYKFPPNRPKLSSPRLLKTLQNKIVKAAAQRFILS